MIYSDLDEIIKHDVLARIIHSGTDTRVHVVSYKYSFKWYDIGTGVMLTPIVFKPSRHQGTNWENMRWNAVLPVTLDQHPNQNGWHLSTFGTLNEIHKSTATVTTRWKLSNFECVTVLPCGTKKLS